jgi:hypothetical protein
MRKQRSEEANAKGLKGFEKGVYINLEVNIFTESRK